MHAFRRTRRGYLTRLDATERAIVGRVVADVATLLGWDVTEPYAPDDAEPDGRRGSRGEGTSSHPDVNLPDVDWGAVGLGGDEDEEDPRAPLDPALARLLPPASEDDDIAGEVRRLTEESIRSAKGERLRRVWWDLQGEPGRLLVAPEEAMTWAGALTDVRLVLAQRLGVEDAEDSQALEQVAIADADEATRALATLYLALSWLQESLVEAMLGELPEGGAEGLDPLG
ncbi:DUF2017 family protein [Miniimonas arenae]|uniref:DUF2017 family protein n=1 Tax=Miniimonas arenae TaxID=676201 RepID=A0A5C5BA55_9MICO|nr:MULTISPECIES: DUF2017 family protein [Miniimonas]TNU73710.1 DUF2017 family protein [Miniimonas arenae]